MTLVNNIIYWEAHTCSRFTIAFQVSSLLANNNITILTVTATVNAMIKFVVFLNNYKITKPINL